ncbi:sialidase family protein [Sunxiuqinia indica]|uniref:sialidase family protein n=1 Tax=Sunxiuqinia indica TaxID=2692584 RepID=UPI001357345C|nr:sialidase family protein [Sunxiuqinia indica]
MKKNSVLVVLLSLIVVLTGCTSQKERTFKEGIVLEEFIYETAPFPSSHAGTIVETTDGTMVTSWFGGTYERDPDVCIYVSRKVDGEWTEPENVADGIQNDTLRYPTWNPVLFQVPNGELQLYYKIGAHPDNWRGWMKTSEDGGVTWSEAIALPDGIIGPVKNKPVLIDGKIISPTSTEEDGWQVYFEISDDLGKTWRKTEPINDGYDIIAIQPSILEYPDGRLQALTRSKNRAVLQSWSDDRGETWSEMTKTSLPQNNSGTDAVTLADGRQLLVYNHVLPPGDKFKGGRSPLNVAVSKDGENWSAALVLEDEPEQRFSYPAVIQTNDGMIHILYTWKRVKMKHVVVDPSKMELTPIVDGQWPEKSEQ